MKLLNQTRTTPIVNGDTVLAQINDFDPAEGIRFDITMLTQGAITGTVQWFMQDSSDGQTWDDVISSNTFAFGAALTSQRFSVALTIAAAYQPAGAFTQGGPVSNLALAAGTIRNGPVASRLRIVERVTAIAGTPTGPQYRIALTGK